MKDKFITRMLCSHDRDARSMLISPASSTPLFRMIQRLKHFDGMVGYADHERLIKNILVKWPEWQIEGMWQENEREEFRLTWYQLCFTVHKWVRRRMVERSEEPAPFPEYEDIFSSLSA